MEDTPNVFTLEVGERRGWKMEGQSFGYDIEPGTYTITINGLQSQGGGNSNEDVTKDDETSIIK